MKAWARRVFFDYKLLGPNLYVPLIGDALMLMYVVLTRGVFDLVCAELFAPILSAWWGLFLLQPELEGDPGGLLATYPRRPWQRGVMTFLRSDLYACVWLCLLSAALGGVLGGGMLAIFLQLVIQAQFMMGLAFLSISLTHSVSVSLVILALYELAAYLQKDSFPAIFNIFVYSPAPLPFPALSASALTVLPWSALFFLAGQCLFTDFSGHRWNRRRGPSPKGV